MRQDWLRSTYTRYLPCHPLTPSKAMTSLLYQTSRPSQARASFPVQHATSPCVLSPVRTDEGRQIR